LSALGLLISHIYRSRFPSARTCVTCLALVGAISLLGCQAIYPANSNGAQSAAISGSVHGGQQPVAGASIELYAAGTGGDGSAATTLLTKQVTTNNSGSFNLTGLYRCPTANSEVYLVATGGNPGLGNGQSNAQIALMTALGPCGNLTAATSVEINEVTTVAAAYALSPYMRSYSSIGSNSTDAQMMADAFTMASELANPSLGSTPGIGVPTGQVVPSQKLNTLADILSACINSSGGRAGDLNPCGLLFSFASAASGVAPTETIGALLEIAQNPASNVVSIFDLNPPTDPFQPSLAAAPADWTLKITSPTSSPTFSPAPGIYATLPSVILSDTNPSAAIYYTTDGSSPTSASTPYSGAVALSNTTTVRAIAISGGIGSLVSDGSFILAALLHQVDLSWNAPSSSPDPLAGYNVYRSSDGGTTYQLLNSGVDTGTAYEDTVVQSGHAYNYYVTSVDAFGVESVGSNMIGVTIP
jgi:Chitobiase/beta-hexosaminidase C-terminal domain